MLADVGEVLLVKEHNNDVASTGTEPRDNSSNNINEISQREGTDFGTIEVLEGLTSNVFFVYPGGILRTAPSDQDVLNGYARKLILDHASDCGFIVDTRHPVLLHDMDQWEEIFITSSIRILTPLTELLIPIYKNDDSNGEDEEDCSRSSSSYDDDGYDVTPTI